MTRKKVLEFVDNFMMGEPGRLAKKYLLKENPKLINVLGEVESDPVCDYFTCYHPFSIHGQRSHTIGLECRCNHPTNKALGVTRPTDEEQESDNKKSGYGVKRKTKRSSVSPRVVHRKRGEGRTD